MRLPESMCLGISFEGMCLDINFEKLNEILELFCGARRY